ncbi:D-alanyl-D-alanine carboxypeptidase family protein [Streptomyces umbrinus]|uniref:D-alanyl-D-alanine carboxypeptidase family protein n=1 Tax=Streptomyces umbrinus TaxID=67370 RepID=UPI0033CB00B2
MTTPPMPSVEHWAFQVDTPFREPAEIRELTERPHSESAGGVASEDGLGADVEEDFEDLGTGEETYDETEYADATTMGYGPEPASVSRLPEPVVPADEPTVATAQEITWSGSTEQAAFREAVLQAHLARSRMRKGPPGRDLSDAELARVPHTDVRMRRDAAAAAGRLIAAATTALAQAQQEGDQDALQTRRITAASGYRGSEHQAKLWRRYFPDYYQRTARHRQALATGPHGTEAVDYMIRTFGVPRWIAAPGYSNHQSGIAIDLHQERTGAPIRNSSRTPALAAWRRSWLHRWLTGNAAAFGFQPYLREPWHWEYRPTPVGEAYEAWTTLGSSGREEDATEAWSASEASGYEEDAPEPPGHEEEAPEAGAQLDAPETGMAHLDQLAPLLEEAEGLFDRAREAYRDAVDVVKTRLRIGQGFRDETRLTDLVFLDRHPDRVNRPLQRQDPDFAVLSREWHVIRDRIVRPALEVGSRPRYDRAGAIAYARKYWLRPCDDGFIATRTGGDFEKVPIGTKFEHEFQSNGVISNGREHALLPDGSHIPWERLDDCTHFISCCIGQRPGEACGGLPITYRQLGAPPHAPYGIVRVSTMVEYLTGGIKDHPKYAETIAEKSGDDSMIGKLSPGDLVAYFHKRFQTYTHLAMLLGGGRIACHSYGRSDQPECTWTNGWDLDGDTDTHLWTFLRLGG